MEIQRRVEKAVVKHLEAQLPGRRFFAAEEDNEVEAPYTVVAADDEESRLDDESASFVVVDVIHVTHIDDTDAAAHSEAVREIRAAMATMTRGFHQEAGVILHGIDIMSSVRVTDDGQARGHAITVNVGAGML